MEIADNRKGLGNLEELELQDPDCKVIMLITYKEIKHKLQDIFREKKVIKRDTVRKRMT